MMPLLRSLLIRLWIVVMGRLIFFAMSLVLWLLSSLSCAMMSKSFLSSFMFGFLFHLLRVF